MIGRSPPWWMLLAAASFVAYFVLTLYCDFWGPEPVGIVPDFRGGRMAVRSLVAGSPAQRAGVRPGDVLLAAQGRSVRNLMDWTPVRANVEVDRPLALTVERAGEVLELRSISGRQRWSQWNLPKAVRLALRSAQLVALGLALVIAFRRPHDLVARLGAWFLATIATSSIVLTYGIAVAWRRLPLFLGVFLLIPFLSRVAISSILFTFFAVFPRRLFKTRWPWLLVWAPSLLGFLGVIPFTLRMVYRPGTEVHVSSALLSIGALKATLYTLAAMVVLALGHRRLRDRNERRRVRVLVVGMAVGCLPVLPAALVAYWPPAAEAAPVLLSVPSLLLVQLAATVFPLSFAYAILRHRLFDLRIIVRLGLRYALARGALLSLVPCLAVLLLADLLVLHADQPVAVTVRAHGWIYGMLAALILAALWRRQAWLSALDRRFFRERYDGQRLLREVVEEARRAESFAGVAPRVVARVEAALHPEFVALLARQPREASYVCLAASPAGYAPPPLPAGSPLGEFARALERPFEASPTGSGWLRQRLPLEAADFVREARIELMVPVARTRDHAEALMVLGPKRSEEPYSGEDRELLMAIAAGLALLLERPAPPAQPSEAFEECPRCGGCYDPGTAECRDDGAALARIPLPRSLAGRYRLDRRLGRGGMATVYEASDTALDRRVAVKLIREELVGSADLAERFRQEARLVAGFSHPNVVRVYDFGVAAGTRAFLAMELLDGLTLREEIRREGRLPARRTVPIVRDVCSALGAAHAQRLVHRDLKPDNVFLVRADGEASAKLLDFGIAKLLRSEPDLDTTRGMIVGTPHYMAPERLLGGDVSPLWDLWALAVVSYQMLAGAHPFGAPGRPELQQAVLSGRFTPIGEHLPGAPPLLQDFFTRALALEPERRPQSAREFLEGLRTALA